MTHTPHHRDIYRLLTLLLRPQCPTRHPPRRRPIIRHHHRRAQHHKSNRRPNRPKEFLIALHSAQITRVHTQIARHKRKRQEDNRDDRKDNDCLVVGFRFERDGLGGDIAGGFGLGSEFVKVVDTLLDGFEHAVEDADAEVADTVGVGDGGSESAEGLLLLPKGVFDDVEFFTEELDVVVDLLSG